MMNNRLIEGRTLEDINEGVDRVLRDLGNPEPPLNLDHVRDLLNLDLRYYSSSDPGILQEVFHRMKVAGKQILRRPTLLMDVIRKMDLKALWVPDRKQILLDSDLPSAKQRWGEAHEIGHSLIPWHESMTHGDATQQLSLDCQVELESEANYAAGQLLFLREEFNDRALDSSPEFSQVKHLSKTFKNTITSTLWRYVEASKEPMFGLVSGHPHDSSPRVRYFIRSRAFATMFPNTTGTDILSSIGSFIVRRSRGPMGGGDVVIETRDGLRQVFLAESFNNSYDILTLGVYRHPAPKKYQVLW